MKVYGNYLAEFDAIFQENEKILDKSLLNVTPSLKNNHKMNIQKKGTLQSKIISNVLDKDDGQNPNLICVVDEILKPLREILSKIDPKIIPVIKELFDPEKIGYVRKDRYMKAM